MQGTGNDSENEDGLVIASPGDDDDVIEQGCPYDEMDSLLNRSSSDDEADEHLPLPQESAGNTYRKFGQEVILFERTAHTPPSRWMLVDEKDNNRWPYAERVRNCSSAPPSATSPIKDDGKEELSIPQAMMSFMAVSVSSTSSTSCSHDIQQEQHNHAAQQSTTPVYSYSSREVADIYLISTDIKN
ncbi:C2H2-type domain-containing protein [Trichostrongylus colubriformis]|uniref:C2H2-type domain-containing protein n=1 Tax=Trichostrongylus colubriformis TaxID=6319 RepID=A0AAN8F3T4_TRICO